MALDAAVLKRFMDAGGVDFFPYIGGVLVVFSVEAWGMWWFLLAVVQVVKQAVLVMVVALAVVASVVVAGGCCCFCG